MQDLSSPKQGWNSCPSQWQHWATQAVPAFREISDGGLAWFTTKVSVEAETHLKKHLFAKTTAPAPTHRLKKVAYSLCPRPLGLRVGMAAGGGLPPGASIFTRKLSLTGHRTCPNDTATGSQIFLGLERSILETNFCGAGTVPLVACKHSWEGVSRFFYFPTMTGLEGTARPRLAPGSLDAFHREAQTNSER